MSDAQTFEPRRAEPGATFTWHDAEGVAHEMTADADGVVRPDSPEAAAIADSFELPVARRAVTQQKAAAAAKEA